MKAVWQGQNDNMLESIWRVVEDIVQVNLAAIHPLSSFGVPSLKYDWEKGYFQSKFHNKPSQSCRCQL
jgi:hypothetical protein